LASDRMSAFDVVLSDPIPGKGIVLTAISNFWFHRLEGVIANHLTGTDPVEVLADPRDHPVVKDRAVVVHDLKALPIEAVVRGYLIGSGWKDYCKTGLVSGVALPKGLELAERLREPIFTPSTKAAQASTTRTSRWRTPRSCSARRSRARCATLRCNSTRARRSTRARAASSSRTRNSS